MFESHEETQGKHLKLLTGFLPGNFFRERVKSIVMKISFVMLIFLLFSDQISEAKVSEEGKLSQGAPPPPASPRGRKPDYCKN